MEGLWVLLAAALLPLLPTGKATRPSPTLAPPLSMVVAGQRRQLVVCLVSELGPGSGHSVWISSGNSSTLQSFSYGASQEDGGTICTISLLPDDPLPEGDLTCHVGPNRTSPAHSSSPIRITGNEEGVEPCPSSMAVGMAQASVALLVAIRVVLLKVALSDAILTSIFLIQT
ncbi:pre T-cell antigen receptor alpha [Dryobates pubescens]|uniref:pre T-cell antigen receptor alpha n=1 Tax=Dryobates pubescens TaxID=118200 RepID=UPI0023B9FE52|nr:pre T-cell antigen receptor alpha [Dryobates pubescens]